MGEGEGGYVWSSFDQDLGASKKSLKKGRKKNDGKEVIHKKERFTFLRCRLFRLRCWLHLRHSTGGRQSEFLGRVNVV
jgi:hypothetical protein